MSRTSRRSFLAEAGAGAAATAAPTTASAAGAAAGPGVAHRSSLDGPLVAHVSDAAAGRIVLYVGTEEVVVHDHDLVRRLNRAARR